MNARLKHGRPSGAMGSADTRWAAVVNRDTQADGAFFYSVETTGVYCRPSCASRLAKRENVAFHDTAEDAEQAGFRPCKRCRPDRTRQPDRGIRFAVAQCSLGFVLVAKSKQGVCAILLGDSAQRLAHDLHKRLPRAYLLHSESEVGPLAVEVARVVENPRLGLDVPLDVGGTPFQRRVWRVLTGIPAGSTASYAEVARRAGSPRSMRAVAQACGANALAVAIPCHRVVRSDGTLSGYRWGAERKRALLEREAGR